MAKVICSCGFERGGVNAPVGAKVRCPQCGATLLAGPEVTPIKPPTQRIRTVPTTRRFAAAPPKTSMIGVILACAGAGALAGAIILVFFVGRPPAPAPAEGAPLPEAGDKVKALEADLKGRDAELQKARGELSQAAQQRLSETSALQRERDAAKAALEVEKARVRELEKQLASAPPPAEPATPVEVDPEAPEEPKVPPSVADLFQRVKDSVALIQTERGFGTGFVLTAEGLIVTNYHVISGSRSITVSVAATYQGASAPSIVQRAAKALAIDDKNDLAILDIGSGAGMRYAFAPVQMELSRPAQTGEKVVIVGNPGMGSAVLSHTVTEGIVSSASREIEGRKMIQTSAAVNPGNSGGPMFGVDGKVLGVVVAKAAQLENTGFAIPAELVKALFDGRNGAFHVTGTLAQWEQNRAPRTGFNVDTTDGIAVNTTITQMILDEKNGYIYAIDWDQNSLAFVSLKDKKIEESVYLGSEPQDMVLSSDGGTVAVANMLSKTIVEVSVKAKKLVKTYELQDGPREIALAPGFGYFYVASSSMLRFYSTQNRKDYYCGMTAAEIDYDAGAKRLLVGTGSSIIEIDVPEFIPAFRKLDGLKPTDYKRRMEIQKQIDETKKSHSLPQYNYARTMNLMLDAKNKRLYYGKTVLDAGRLGSAVGIFKPSPYSRSGDDAVRWFMQRYPELDNIFAVSPDGKWASSGTHIYSAAKFSVSQELPVPGLAMVFSEDSKVLWLFDVTNKTILPVKMKEP